MNDRQKYSILFFKKLLNETLAIVINFILFILNLHCIELWVEYHVALPLDMHLLLKCLPFMEICVCIIYLFISIQPPSHLYYIDCCLKHDENAF